MAHCENKKTAKDVFVTILEPEEQDRINPKEKIRVTGNDFIDEFAQILVVHKMKRIRFYEKEMGLNVGSMQQLIFFYSGLTFKEWRNEYLMLCAKELLLYTDLTLDEIGRRLDFSCINSFGRWFARLEKSPPSKWRKPAKERFALEEKELFEQWKQERGSQGTS